MIAAVLEKLLEKVEGFGSLMAEARNEEKSMSEVVKFTGRRVADFMDSLRAREGEFCRTPAYSEALPKEKPHYHN